MFTTLAWAKHSQATTARAVSLHDLVRLSTRVARTTALESTAQSEDVGGERHIVTYSRLRVDELIHGGPVESEIWVRTLGGKIDGLGEIVHGEAELALNQQSIVFLRSDADGVARVTAMAQGHYPLLIDAAGAARLQASRNMPHLVANPAGSSAVSELSGKRIDEARSLILGVR